MSLNAKMKRSLWCWLALSPLIVAVLLDRKSVV